MNDIYRAPLFTSWPTPLSFENLKECFSIKRKNFRRKVKEKAKQLSPFSFFSNLFSASVN